MIRTTFLVAVASLALAAACSETTDTTEGTTGSSTTTTSSTGGAGGSGSGSGGSGSGTGGSGTGTGGSGGSGGSAPIGYILKGKVLTPSGAIDGEVFVDGALIGCVAAGTQCETEHPEAKVIDTKGIIAPGMIDTHNHILFDIFNNDDWVPTLPATCTTEADCQASAYCKTAGTCACTPLGCRYKDHTQWPKEAEYGLMLDYKQCLEDASAGKPVWCPLEYDGSDNHRKCEMHKWGSLKGLIAGTTSIVGLPGAGSSCYGGLARPIDIEQNGFKDDKIQTSALFPPSKSSGDGVCANFADGDTDAYLVHVGEGVNQKALDEFTKLSTLTTTPGCLLNAKTAITHGTAFGPTEFAAMAAAGTKLTWSPASNVALYGTTTDIPAALAAGVLVSLAPDWSMGGSQNLLDELRFAKQWSQNNWNGLLTDQQLVEMVTINAATVLGLATSIGSIEEGFIADLTVFSGDVADPYATIVGSTPANVGLVVVGGYPIYGDASLEAPVQQEPPCDTVSICGAQKFVCVANGSGAKKAEQTYADVKTALEDALTKLDGVPSLALEQCGGSCPNGQSCYKRTLYAEADPVECGGSCAVGQACFRVSASGSMPYKCLSVNACAPTKTRMLAPLAPVVACP